MKTTPAEGPRCLQEAPKRPPRGPKTAPRGFKSAPRESQDALREHLGAILGPSWGHLGTSWAIVRDLTQKERNGPKPSKSKLNISCLKAFPKRQKTHIHMAPHWASNMSPLGGSAEALWPQTYQNTLEITCFKALPKRQTPHIRMASHWACNMSPLGRAGAPALRAESGAALLPQLCWIAGGNC